MYDVTSPNEPEGRSGEDREKEAGLPQDNHEGTGGTSTEADGGKIRRTRRLTFPVILYIYGLFDQFGILRYVGKTAYLESRFRDHLRCKNPSHKTNWIKSLLSQGLKPSMEIFEEIYAESDADWQPVERFWISYMRFVGCPLTNLDSGGRGGNVAAESTREKMSLRGKGRKKTEAHKAAIGRAHKGRKLPLSQRAALSKAKKGKKLSPETILAMSKARSGVPLTQAHREAISRANKGKKPSDSCMEANRIAAAAKRLRSEERKRQEKANRPKKPRKPRPPISEETREKIAASKRGKKRPPFSEEWKKNLGASRLGKKGKPMTPEHKAKLIASRLGKPKSEASKEKCRQTMLLKKLSAVTPQSL